MKHNDVTAISAVLRTDFLSFVHRCVQILSPGTKFLPNWHLRAIAYQLERIRTDEINRLILNLPPRHFKSIMVSVAFPAFLLGHDPKRRIIGVSYGEELAEKHAADFRAIVESDWYQRIFPKMRIERAATNDVHTTARGFRLATSINATLTGLGGDCFIIDDPLKPIDAQSESLRNKVNTWFVNTLLSRLDNKNTGAIIIVMQRVHIDDLTGHLTNEGHGWSVLSLPAIAEHDETIQFGPHQFHHRKAGEALHPEHESLEILSKLRLDMGADVFSAQYQQTPIPPGGTMIRREWLKYYDEAPARSYRTKIIQSWDTAAKSGGRNDWSVCTTWLLANNCWHLLDLVRGRYDYPDLKRIAMNCAERFTPDTILIEDASTGIALAQELKHFRRFPVRLVRPEVDKIGRLYVQQAKFEAGLVAFPKNAPFLPALEAELFAFPNGKTDDQVDSISQALAYKPSSYNLTHEALS